jgi:hypothetical protein
MHCALDQPGVSRFTGAHADRIEHGSPGGDAASRKQLTSAEALAIQTTSVEGCKDRTLLQTL